MAGHAASGVAGREESGSRWLGGCPLRHGLSESALAPEQHGLGLPDQDVGSVADLLALFHEVLCRLSHIMRPGLYLRGQHGAAKEMCSDGFGKVPTAPGHMFVRFPPTMSAASCV